MSENFKDVQAFHEKFNVPRAERPSFLPYELLQFRVKFMLEELQEFNTATGNHFTIVMDQHRPYDPMRSPLNMHEAADALVDLVYVALGTADMMGLPWQQLWDEVQRKNIAKVRAVSAQQSKRGTVYDVVKPHGWTPPDHFPALGNGPFNILEV
jgi:predicted HAD superfamily Cof-like phosphohydrolase